MENKQKPLWQKTTGGYLRIGSFQEGRRRIKPNEKIRATEEELEGYIGQFKLIEGTITKTEEKDEVIEPPKKQTSKYSVVHEGKGWHNVVSEEGKVMNEKKLRADEAEKLANDLNG